MSDSNTTRGRSWLAGLYSKEWHWPLPEPPPFTVLLFRERGTAMSADALVTVLRTVLPDWDDELVRVTRGGDDLFAIDIPRWLGGGRGQKRERWAVERFHLSRAARLARCDHFLVQSTIPSYSGVVLVSTNCLLEASDAFLRALLPHFELALLQPRGITPLTTRTHIKSVLLEQSRLQFINMRGGVWFQRIFVGPFVVAAWAVALTVMVASSVIVGLTVELFAPGAVQRARDKRIERFGKS